VGALDAVPQANPIGDGVNWYAYADNNPITGIDPEGLTSASNAAFLGGWLAGTLPSDISYGGGSLEVNEMMVSPGVNRMRNSFYQGKCKTITYDYGTWEAYRDTVLNPRYWSSTAAQVGGFAGATATNNGNGTVTFTITNVAGSHSFFLHDVPNSPFSRGPMHNVTQHFAWTEPIDPSKCPCP
jgi:hypothetical protein